MGNPAKSFEDLAVYQHARALVNEVYKITRLVEFRRD
jgi:hypothetical protein